LAFKRGMKAVIEADLHDDAFRAAPRRSPAPIPPRCARRVFRPAHVCPPPRRPGDFRQASLVVATITMCTSSRCGRSRANRPRIGLDVARRLRPIVPRESVAAHRRRRHQPVIAQRLEALHADQTAADDRHVHERASSSQLILLQISEGAAAPHRGSHPVWLTPAQRFDPGGIQQNERAVAHPAALAAGVAALRDSRPVPRKSNRANRSTLQ
jgi:hypothetical protein